jgi:hypothetical protein
MGHGTHLLSDRPTPRILNYQLPMTAATFFVDLTVDSHWLVDQNRGFPSTIDTVDDNN